MKVIGGFLYDRSTEVAEHRIGLGGHGRYYVMSCVPNRMSEPALLHVTCAYCGQKLTLQFADWPETLDAATKPQTKQSWTCPACMKLNTGEFAAKLGWVWKGHRTAPSR